MNKNNSLAIASLLTAALVWGLIWFPYRALDAAGAALGCIGLAGFALVVWQLLGSHETWIVLGGAGLLWLGISGLCWRILKLC